MTDNASSVVLSMPPPLEKAPMINHPPFIIKRRNYPKMDLSGKAFTVFCEDCGKGFHTPQAKGGHRSNHKRMQNKHRDKYSPMSISTEKPKRIRKKRKRKTKKKKKAEKVNVYRPPITSSVPSVSTTVSVSTPASVSSVPRVFNDDEPNIKQTMNKIIDNLWEMDTHSTFKYTTNNNSNSSSPTNNSISLQTIRKNIDIGKYHNIEKDFMKDISNVFRDTIDRLQPTHMIYRLASKMRKSAYAQITHAAQPVNDRKLRSRNKENAIIKKQYSPSIKCLKIENYETIFENEFFCDEQYLRNKLQTDKKGCCDGRNCDEFQKFGTFDSVLFFFQFSNTFISHYISRALLSTPMNLTPIALTVD